MRCARAIRICSSRTCRAAGALLSPQAAATDGPDWDVLQEAGPDSDTIIFIYSSDDASDAIVVKPADLQPQTTYTVQSVDAGALGTATGAELMADGVDVM